ncbi:MAG: methylated-DNA--[protein]-cysteine S-methyltransferase [Natronomonas sp.]|nr:methylated-DNA--[protein]-cysteine S-methyltransferase [Natronomonas sp.]
MEIELFESAFAVDETYIDESPAEIREQIGEYERGERRTFDLAIDAPDTFTGRVMGQMIEIPYGETRTYGEIADALDTSPIAVDGACGRNSVTVVVPCHRVVKSDGGLGGFSASGGVAVKRRMLDHEAEHASA